MNQLIRAPAGWGHRPGAIIAGLSADSLPDMPMLRMLDAQRRNTAIVLMLRDNPALWAVLRPRDLVRKYGIAQATASALLQKARPA